MSEKNKIKIDNKFFETEFSEITNLSDSLSRKTYKVNNPYDYRFFDVEPNSIYLIKKDSLKIEKIIFDVDTLNYSSMVLNIYEKFSTPNIFINLKESTKENTKTMKWFKDSSNTIPFSSNKLKDYNLLCWKIKGYDVLIKNNFIETINIEIISNDK